MADKDQGVQATDDIAAKMDQVSQDITTVLGQIQAKIEDLKELEANWAKVQQVTRKRLSELPTKIVLDVGGKRFATAKSTLLRVPNSYFHGLFGSDNFKADADGSYFIDRNPKYFDMVLDYLRDWELPPTAKQLSADERSLLVRHFEYLMIPYPKPKFEWDPSRCGNQLTINGMIVSRPFSGGSWNAAVQATIPVQTRFSVKVTTTCNAAMIGLDSKDAFQANGDNNSRNIGFYFHTGNCYSYSPQGQGAAPTVVSRVPTAGDTIEVLIEKNQVVFKVSGQIVTTVQGFSPNSRIWYPSIEMCSTGSFELLNVE